MFADGHLPLLLNDNMYALLLQIIHRKPFAIRLKIVEVLSLKCFAVYGTTEKWLLVSHYCSQTGVKHYQQDEAL